MSQIQNDGLSHIKSNNIGRNILKYTQFQQTKCGFTKSIIHFLAVPAIDKMFINWE
jgi:hypothetical protein